jgi:hypothetical protein
MANQQTTKSSKAADKQANETWENFMKASKVCGVFIVVTLILMAIFLV